jgi:DNA-binding response OmpR family regulator
MAGRILLVEVDVVLGAVLGEVLRRNGYAVTTVRSLKGGIEHLDSVSAVILDVDALSAEGELALLDVLRPYGESLPTVLMGLQVSDALHHRLRGLLRREQPTKLTWVQKPFQNEELLEAVRRVHHKNCN